MAYESRLELSVSTQKGSQQLDKFEGKLRSTERAGQGMSGSMDQVTRSAGHVTRAINIAQAAVVGLAGAFSAREIIQYTDAWNNAANQLRQVTKSTGELTDVQKQLVDVARESRSSFESTAQLYSRLAKSTEELGLNQSELIDLTSTLNKALSTSGATSAEAAGALTQLGQALASGVLRGDEFNSIAEQAPGIMRAIAESLNMTIGELREFASEGGITAEIVVNAMQEASDQIDDDFSKSVATFGQSMEVARTNLLEWVGTSEEVQGAVKALGDGIVVVSEHADGLAKAAQIAGAGAGAYYAYRGAVVAATAAQWAFNAAVRANPLGAIITVLGTAAGALFTFRHELGLVEKPALDAADAMDLLGGAVSDTKKEVLEFQIATLTSQMLVLQSEANATTEALDRLKDTRRQPYSYGQGQQGDLTAGIDRQRNQLETLQSQIDDRAKMVKQLQDLLNKPADKPPGKPGLGLTEAAEASDAFGRSLQSLQDQLFPVEVAQREFTQQQTLLQTALMNGSISIDRYLEAWQRLQEAHLSQQSPSEAYSQGFGAQIGIGSMVPQQSAMQQWLESARTAFTDFDTMAANSAEIFTTRFGNAFEAAIFDAQTLDEGLRGIGETLIRSVVNSLGQMAAQWLAVQAVQLAIGKTSETAAVASAATTGAAIAAAYAPAAAAASLASFGANSAPAIAGMTAAYSTAQGLSFAGMFDKGGSIPSGSWGIAGEYGPEIVQGPAKVTSRKDTASAMQPTIVINNNSSAQVRQRKNEKGVTVLDIIEDLASEGPISRAMHVFTTADRRPQ